jgi:hypothetical protein
MGPFGGVTPKYAQVVDGERPGTRLVTDRAMSRSSRRTASARRRYSPERTKPVIALLVSSSSRDRQGALGPDGFARGRRVCARPFGHGRAVPG